jgi:hypothetical protein
VGRGRRREHQGGLLGDGAQAEGDEVGDERIGVDVVRHGRQGTDQRLAQRADEGRGGELDVLAGQLAGVDALAQDLREAGGVGPAEGQALDLDGRIDGLGQQRPGQAPAAEGAPGEGVHRGGQPLGRRAARRPGGGARGIDLALRGAPEDLREELGLGREVVVHAAGGDPGARGHRRHLRLAIAPAGDQRMGGAHDPLAGGRAAGLGAVGRAIRHTRSEP